MKRPHLDHLIDLTDNPAAYTLSQTVVFEGHDVIGTYRLTEDDRRALRVLGFTCRPAAEYPVPPTPTRAGGIVAAIVDAAGRVDPF